MEPDPESAALQQKRHWASPGGSELARAMDLEGSGLMWTHLPAGTGHLARGLTSEDHGSPGSQNHPCLASRTGNVQGQDIVIADVKFLELFS